MNAKSPPIRERREARRCRYGPEYFDAESPYHTALRSTEVWLDRFRDGDSRLQRRAFNVLLVHECEMARKWRTLWEDHDDPQRAKYDWLKISQNSLMKVKRIASELRKLDGRLGYDLRNAFSRSAQFAISPSIESTAIMPDPNLPDGGFEIPTGGRVAQTVELQLLARLFQVNFEEWLEALEAEIDGMYTGFQIGHRIGPIELDPPLTERAVKNRDATQLAILALVARLRMALGIAAKSSNSLPRYEAVNGNLSKVSAPPWDLIHQFVQASFLVDADTLDLNSLKQRWSSATGGRSIRVIAWPDTVIRQTQKDF